LEHTPLGGITRNSAVVRGVLLWVDHRKADAEERYGWGGDEFGGMVARLVSDHGEPLLRAQPRLSKK